MRDPILVANLIHRDMDVLLRSLPFSRYYDLYRHGGRLYLDTGTGRMLFTFTPQEEYLMHLEPAIGRWIFEDLEVNICDPRLTFPLDYFEECMRDECCDLQRELEESAEECVQDLLFRAAVGSKNH